MLCLKNINGAIKKKVDLYISYYNTKTIHDKHVTKKITQAMKLYNQLVSILYLGLLKTVSGWTTKEIDTQMISGMLLLI